MKKTAILIIAVLLCMSLFATCALAANGDFRFELAVKSAKGDSDVSGTLQRSNTGIKGQFKITSKNFSGSQRMDFAIVNGSGVQATDSKALQGNTIKLKTMYYLTFGGLYDVKGTHRLRGVVYHGNPEVLIAVGAWGV